MAKPESEYKPSKEEIAAKDTFRRALFDYLCFNGIDPQKAVGSIEALLLTFSFGSDTRQYIPQDVVDFVNNQYPSRDVNIDTFQIRYEPECSLLVGDKPVRKQEFILASLSVSTEYPTNVSNAESISGFSQGPFVGIAVPSEECIKSNTIQVHIVGGVTMQYYVDTVPLLDVVLAKESTSISDQVGLLEPQIVASMARMISSFKSGPVSQLERSLTIGLAREIKLNK